MTNTSGPEGLHPGTLRDQLIVEWHDGLEIVPIWLGKVKGCDLKCRGGI